PVAAALFLAASPATAQAPDKEWRLTWSDEFGGDKIDRAKWDHDIGNGFYSYDANQWISGWGNGELQYYVREQANSFVKDGALHVRAVKESLHGCGYTSAKLRTRKRDGTPLFAQRYGKFEFRAKLPTGRGIWPALWMLPQEEKHGAWPLSGEIDVMEARGQEPGKVLGTLHYGAKWPGNTHASREFVFPKGQSIAEFHVYAMEWEPGEIRWSVDGKEYAKQSFWWSAGTAHGGKRPAREVEMAAWPAPFDESFHLVINVAVGGKFLGNPDATTRFPVEMLVDYVRVYEKIGGYGQAKPRGTGELPFSKR
ncbi:MAG TPA: glycoside hydrolase family 16 protein, partial [Planctomycetia bacterium]|nr:glycoside hydrolase family 16 protein [Planctomycetia bacterium]